MCVEEKVAGASGQVTGVLQTPGTAGVNGL